MCEYNKCCKTSQTLKAFKFTSIRQDASQVDESRQDSFNYSTKFKEALMNL